MFSFDQKENPHLSNKGKRVNKHYSSVWIQFHYQYSQKNQNCKHFVKKMWNKMLKTIYSWKTPYHDRNKQLNILKKICSTVIPL